MSVPVAAMAFRPLRKIVAHRRVRTLINRLKHGFSAMRAQQRQKKMERRMRVGNVKGFMDQAIFGASK